MTYAHCVWPRWAIFLLAGLLLSGCRFREPEPSEAVYDEAVAEVPPRPADHLVTEKTVPRIAIEATVGAFDRLAKSNAVAFRPPADLLVRDPTGVFGALGGVCRTLNQYGVAFPCAPDDAARVAEFLKQAASSDQTKRGTTEFGTGDWSSLKGPANGLASIVAVAPRQGLCAPSNGGPESAGKPGGIGDVIRTLSDLADQRQAVTDDTAGVVVNQNGGAWEVCLVLKRSVLGAVPIVGGDFARVWHRGAYTSAQARRAEASAFAVKSGRNPSTLLRITLFHDPESVAAQDLTSAVDLLVR